jgi:hypothetical protein
MIIEIDRIDQWAHAGSLPLDGELRHYYLAAAPYRALLVVRGDTRLDDLRNRHVDVAVGWDSGATPGLVRAPGHEQAKITVFRAVLAPTYPTKHLSDLLADAPCEVEVSQ